MDSVIIISRYKENIDWIKNLKSSYVVYNKGDEIEIPHTVNIPNIGTEPYGYLLYIIDNYENLPDKVIFTQGDPFPHSPQFLSLMDRIDKFDSIQPLTSCYNKRVPRHYIRDITLDYLKIDNIPLHIEFYDNNFDTYLQNKIYYQKPLKQVHRILSKFFGNANVRDNIMNFIQIKPREFNTFKVTPFCYSAIFCVSKQKILNYPVSFYNDLKNKCEQLQSIDYRIFGWIMEYAWLEIFRYNPPAQLLPIK